MSNAITWTILAAVAAIVVFLLYRLYGSARTYFQFRGKRLVTCPENHRTAAVELDSGEAAREAFMHKPRMLLSECSRWPERKDCGQQCLAEIAMAPSDCLVRNIVVDWFSSKECVYCGRSIAEVREWWVDHKPALLTPEKQIVTWNEFAPEQLPEFFDKCQPVCWSCSVTETFRRQHPELVSDRAPTPLRIRHIK